MYIDPFVTYTDMVNKAFSSHVIPMRPGDCELVRLKVACHVLERMEAHRLDQAGSELQSSIEQGLFSEVLEKFQDMRQQDAWRGLQTPEFLRGKHQTQAEIVLKRLRAVLDQVQAAAPSSFEATTKAAVDSAIGALTKEAKTTNSFPETILVLPPELIVGAAVVASIGLIGYVGYKQHQKAEIRHRGTSNFSWVAQTGKNEPQDRSPERR